MVDGGRELRKGEEESGGKVLPPSEKLLLKWCLVNFHSFVPSSLLLSFSSLPWYHHPHHTAGIPEDPMYGARHSRVGEIASGLQRREGGMYVRVRAGGFGRKE